MDCSLERARRETVFMNIEEWRELRIGSVCVAGALATVEGAR